MQVAPSCDVSELAAFPLFTGLEDSLLQRFLEDHRVLLVPAAQQIVFEADWSEGLFLIRTGIVKVRSINVHGGEVVVALLGIGDMFGELAMLQGHGRRSADVVALTPLEVVKLRWSGLQQELQRSPSFALAMARLQAARLLAMGKRFTLRGEDATTRVLATLLELARCNSDGQDPQGVIPCLSQTEIATISGLARGTTSKILTQLRTRGTLVDTPTGLQIADLKPLRKRGLIS
ncbi:Crp/Fnr family transcriptional regulator [Cyanobium sp. CH-040]|uniref:Crp/Fnr family transcriptional regulator n=1 Tax=Cyanobium sp. CH-040 TaxID=2823708 RepID=UPI0020CBE527|nr:Crp/Fnr family transcriptional regulator [Cyanobium sp. CH-040]MCP9928260.1 Crp/Fnr family transcriptional regulator [Cyanobium sp. CH-040]